MAKPWEQYNNTSYVGPSISQLKGRIYPDPVEMDYSKLPDYKPPMDTVGWQAPYSYEGIYPLLGLLETVDYLTAAPIRYGIKEAVQGVKSGDYNPANFFRGVYKSFANPRTAPTGKDISREMGLSDKGLNQLAGDQYAPNISPAGVAGFALENMLDPTNLLGAGLFGGGIKAVGKLDDVSRAGKSLVKADDILPSTSKEYQDNFKNWFGDSKVVDKEGKPLVVYHGTSGNFDIFDKNKIGETYKSDKEGFFFTTDQSVANNAAIDNEYATGKPLPFGGRNIMPIYIKAEKPLKLNINAEKFDSSNKTKIFKDAKKNGYDAIILNDGTHIVFTPTQIKSATGNRGTFDPKDPNILRALTPIAGGGAIYSQQNNRQKDADGKRSK